MNGVASDPNVFYGFSTVKILSTASDGLRSVIDTSLVSKCLNCIL
jgi:hypothetical protein